MRLIHDRAARHARRRIGVGWAARGFALLLVLLVSVRHSARAETIYYEDLSEESIFPEEYSLLGTAWLSGGNSIRIGTVPPTPGGATFSIMGPGLSSSTTNDTAHNANTTAVITALNIAGFTFNDYRDMINSALNQWDAVSGFTNLGFVADGNVNAGASQASGGAMGDIRVAAWEITTNGVLGHGFQPANETRFGPGGTIGGDVHIDVNQQWVNSPTAALPQIDLYTAVLHEIGHALGLGHSTVSGSVMEAVYTGPRRTLTADDIAGIQAIYGVPEPGSFVLMVIGGGALVLWKGRRRRPPNSV